MRLSINVLIISDSILIDKNKTGNKIYNFALSLHSSERNFLYIYNKFYKIQDLSFFLVKCSDTEVNYDV